MDNKSKLNISIIGLGLIGGSIKLALEKSGECHVVGFDKKWPENFEKIIKKSDVIFIATPISQVINILSQIKPFVKPETIITDVASVKTEICKTGKQMFPCGNFIGGHPMAGTEKSGFANAEGNLFTKRTWILEKNSKILAKLIRLMGAKPLVISPKAHDKLVASISHLPFIISSGVFLNSTSNQNWKKAKMLGAGGFRDTTRLASGNPQLHTEIVLANKVNILNELQSFNKNVVFIQKLISERNRNKLFTFFQNNKSARDEWLGEVLI